jgi:formylglycine-generating enzyme required for sulfatase activity/serine/threonine protein kinase
MTREAALNALLGSLFSAEELRVYLARERGGEDLEGSLPEVGATRATVVSAAVDALRRRGLIDRDFFDNLEAARPLRVGDIRKVRGQWLHNARLDRGELWAEGRYQLESMCGQGGFGLVWKAIDTRTGAFVALKVLLEQHSEDRRVRQRFFRGAEVLARLAHPAIVGIRSGVEQEGLRFFYVMEFIDGVRLDALVGKRPRAELLGYILQIGEALGHIHARDLLHRDIKPSNILVTKRQAKLIDFDLVAGDAFASLTTRALGTAIYAPPEAIASDKKTAAYDVFSLARTVEYVIRGREPEVAELAARDHVATLDTSEAVKAVLRAALRADPGERTPSVEQFCADLRAALEPPTRPVAAPVIAAEPTEQRPSPPAISPVSPPVEPPVAAPVILAVPTEPIRGVRPILSTSEVLSAASVAATARTPSRPRAIESKAKAKSGLALPAQESARSRVIEPEEKHSGPPGAAASPARAVVMIVGLVAAMVLAGVLWCGDVEPPAAVVAPENFARPEEPAEPAEVENPPPVELPKPPQCSEPALTALADVAAMCFVALPAGEFKMGSLKTEPDRDKDENQHKARVDAFAVGTHEVTLGQWKLVMNTSPNDCKYGCDDTHPVSNVSWNDACQFMVKLTDRENAARRQASKPELTPCYAWDGTTCTWADHACTGYRLPTETEWEYAARARTQTAYFFGAESKELCKHGNGADQAAKREHPQWTIVECDDGYPHLAPVGKFPPNTWGLHDVHGNVWEWVWDRYADTYKSNASALSYAGPAYGDMRVLRGGSFGDGPRWLRAAYRGWNLPADQGPVFGLRCVRGAPQH